MKILVSIGLMLLPFLGVTQQYGTDVNEMRVVVFTGDLKSNVGGLDYSEIKGSPYIVSDLQDGIVYFIKSNPIKSMLRYNAYTDEIEFIEKEQLKFLMKKYLIEKVKIGNDTYRYLSFFDFFKRQHNGYLKEIYSGPSKLFIREQVIFYPEEKVQTAYGQYKPNRFERVKDVIYYSFNNGVHELPMRRSQLVNIFPTNQLDVKNFIKKNKVRPTVLSSIIALFEYYDSINNL